MNNRYLMTLAAPLVFLALALPAAAADGSAATKTCKDGTASTATGKGACSGHGGVQKAAKTTAAPAPAAATPAPAAAAAPAKTATGSADATGATAKCKDGSYSHAKSHSGACSKHGGVADFLTQ
jgi:hypothetical protein